MHCKQSGRLVDRKTAVRSGLHVKVGYARVFFIEKKDVAVRGRTSSQQLMRMVTSADYLHVYPPERGLVMEPKQ